MTFYCLSRNRLRIIQRIPLSTLSKIKLIKGSSALIQFTQHDKTLFTMETLKRIELLFFIKRQSDTYEWLPKLKIVQASTFQMVESGSGAKEKLSSVTLTLDP